MKKLMIILMAVSIVGGCGSTEHMPTKSAASESFDEMQARMAKREAEHKKKIEAIQTRAALPTATNTATPYRSPMPTPTATPTLNPAQKKATEVAQAIANMNKLSHTGSGYSSTYITGGCMVCARSGYVNGRLCTRCGGTGTVVYSGEDIGSGKHIKDYNDGVENVLDDIE